MYYMFYCKKKVMPKMMTTNQITAKYGITRQTLNNWVQKNISLHLK